MRIAISNLAWDRSNDEQVASLLKKYDIDAIDIAPGKYFANYQTVSTSEIDSVRNWWLERGITITGMQALLFGTTGLNMFGTETVQGTMLSHFVDICRIGERLGATKLVFGSPKNRDRSSLSDAQATNEAILFFRSLGDIAHRHSVTICLEPNPTRYGANFMTNSTETAAIVRDVSHPSIRMQLDTGAMTINGEDPFEVIYNYFSLVGHIHASEPDLVALGDGKTDHSKVASLLSEYLPSQVVCIEMLPAKNELNISAIERALGVATNHYRTMDSK